MTKCNALLRIVVAIVVLFLVGWTKAAHQSTVALPMVESAQVPLYPAVARMANLGGAVHIGITTDGHRIVSTRVEDGNKVLAGSAEENLRTWQFAVHEPTTFTVTYYYKLVTDLEPTQNNPRVILNLPTKIEVDALRWPGTADMRGEVKDRK